MAKRNPTTTASEQAQMFQDVRHKLSAPVGLSKAALPFWESIAATRAPQEWSAADIPVAAQLAEDQALLVTLRARLNKEGWTDRHAAALLHAAHTRVLSISRTLQLHPRGRTGRQSRDVVAQRRAAQEAAETLGVVDDDPMGLISH